MMGLKVVDFDQSCGCLVELDFDDWEMEQHKIKEEAKDGAEVEGGD